MVACVVRFTNPTDDAVALRIGGAACAVAAARPPLRALACTPRHAAADAAAVAEEEADAVMTDVESVAFELEPAEDEYLASMSDGAPPALPPELLARALLLPPPADARGAAAALLHAQGNSAWVRIVADCIVPPPPPPPPPPLDTDTEDATSALLVVIDFALSVRTGGGGGSGEGGMTVPVEVVCPARLQFT
ncbi:hypothetical protein JKP88DRAFT_231366 [Tribonema minus]|uniref:Uncharacterized protein n=1 Tax=Tribonema minus TaxID=303371 RepID=A0A835ZCG6_9STRA|nr:hypothetical protein JKP88DRAFT_231366 [Tribonema minus]